MAAEQLSDAELRKLIAIKAEDIENMRGKVGRRLCGQDCPTVQGRSCSRDHGHKGLHVSPKRLSAFVNNREDLVWGELEADPPPATQAELQALLAALDVFGPGHG